jgi:hypothetical protein
MKQGDSLAKTKFVSSVPSIMSNIFDCSARMVANRSRVWKVMTSLMMNFDLQLLHRIPPFNSMYIKKDAEHWKNPR